MGQTENVEKAPKTSWFDGVKAEFKKIIWPEQKSVVRQTIAVIVTSVVVGLIIALLDWAINSLIYDWNGITFFNLFSGRYQIFCHGCNLVVNILIQTIQIRINTVKKTDPECDGSHIQILLLDHFVGFLYFPAVNHSLLPPCFRYDAFFQKFLRADI